MPSTRTFLVNPNYISMMGWKQIIGESPFHHWVSCAPSVETLAASPPTNALILADLSAAAPSEIARIETLRSQPGIDILLVVDVKDKTLIRALLAMNIRGILTTHCNDEEIKMALDNLRLGKKFYCKEILKVSGQAESRERIDQEDTILSVREQEVLGWIGRGLTTSQIAEQLCVSAHTINSHRKNMLKKLGLTSPVELIVYAAKNGLIDLV